jgi:choline dehydrogenase-like flavoprotein
VLRPRGSRIATQRRAECRFAWKAALSDGARYRVVDASGSVHGVEDLCVADASVMPTIPRANTNVTIVVLAERLAEPIAGPEVLATGGTAGSGMSRSR